MMYPLLPPESQANQHAPELILRLKPGIPSRKTTLFLIRKELDGGRIASLFFRLSLKKAQDLLYKSLKLARSVEAEGLFVRLDRVALRFPALQPACQEFDLREMQSESTPQNNETGLIAGARAIYHRVFVPRDQRRILPHFSWSNPFRPRDNLGIYQKIERLAYIEDKYITIRSQQCMEVFRCDAVPLHFTEASNALAPDERRQNHGANNDQCHSHLRSSLDNMSPQQIHQMPGRIHRLL
jgi:hypothetical protein